MDDSSYKEIRVALRRIGDHLLQAHAAFGAEHETIGFVDVIHDPFSDVADLNYVTPRRNTAWVAGKFVQEGLNRLQEFGRVPRVEYIEGLFPPQFAQILSALGLKSENETILMAYLSGGWSGIAAATIPKLRAPSGVRLALVPRQRGNDLWQALWYDPQYDVLTLGVEPLAVGSATSGRQRQEIDIWMHRAGFPLGVARLSIQKTNASAHIVAISLLREMRTPLLTRLLLAAAMRIALARGATLIFAPGISDDDRALNRELGFVEVGSMVCYAARSENVIEGRKHDILVQPVLALRR